MKTLVPSPEASNFYNVTDQKKKQTHKPKPIYREDKKKTYLLFLKSM